MKQHFFLTLKLFIRVKLWDRLWNAIVNWLNKEKIGNDLPPCDFKQLCYEIRPGDVVMCQHFSGQFSKYFFGCFK
ncbi:hypothetical protein [sulfur-oxidizing endosymbiont of Gigantopelta aegis]|uniref:hypothetical protein n=1 Tax=sulfur-oxidizing endosymbiont of Gigantopelta aegis TaxID=2794934 RepID=UPI0018DDB54C|nr:hypothetical protein [sulfur-oxidizing endosymbiont of Gigantopelta aegis]